MPRIDFWAFRKSRANYLKHQNEPRKYKKDFLVDHIKDSHAYLITLENGKTLANAKGDVFCGLEIVESACFVAPQLLGDSMSGISRSMDCVSFREPLGVVAGICPFNFLAMILLWMLPLAITCGNTMILNSTTTTMTTRRVHTFGRMWNGCGAIPECDTKLYGFPSILGRLAQVGGLVVVRTTQHADERFLFGVTFERMTTEP
jgi:hypothetical protein